YLFLRIRCLALDEELHVPEQEDVDCPDLLHVLGTVLVLVKEREDHVLVEELTCCFALEHGADPRIELVLAHPRSERCGEPELLLLSSLIRDLACSCFTDGYLGSVAFQPV